MKAAYQEIFKQMDAAVETRDYPSMRPLFEPGATVTLPFAPGPLPIWEKWFETLGMVLERQVWTKQEKPLQMEPDQVNRVWSLGIKGDDGHVYAMEGCTIFTFSAKDRISNIHYIMDLTSQRLLLLGKP